MLGQERNADNSVFADEVFPAQGEMSSPDTPEGKQATRVCPEAPGRWGRGNGHVQTRSLFLFLKGTTLSLISVFKCLEDETSFVLLL